MINLLPSELKSSYLYARRNYHLRRWVIAFACTVVGVALLTAGGIFYMAETSKSYEQQIAVNNSQLQEQKLPAIQKQVKDISNNLKLVVQVLSKEVLFSQLLNRLGKVTPSNVILTNLAISQTQGAIDITAQTTDYNAATQMQVNLADPKNQIFAKADIVSISCPANTTGAQYPCTANIRALFAANNPFLFINNSATKAAS